jgi:hypothetical protein
MFALSGFQIKRWRGFLVRGWDERESALLRV